MGSPQAAPQPSPSPFLRLLYPEGSERTIAIEQDTFTIGRRPGCDLVLAEKDISRAQAVIRKTGDAWLLEDQGSTFGTSVNGHPITSVALRNRDLVSMGRERQIEM